MANAVSWKQRRRELTLGGVLVVLAILLWVQLGRAPAGRSAGLSVPGGRPADLSGLKVFNVPWAALDADRPGYDPSGRNIFQFGVIPPPPPPKLSPQEQAAIAEAQRRAEEERQRQIELQRQQEAQRQQEVQQQQAIQAALPPPPPPKPQPPPIAYKFIGYIGPPEAKIAVLHDGTDMVFARQGEVIGKGFRILEIGYESIKFGYTDAQFKGETTTLPMSSAY
jgi:hypothetical protein